MNVLCKAAETCCDNYVDNGNCILFITCFNSSALNKDCEPSGISRDLNNPHAKSVHEHMMGNGEGW